MPYNGSGTFSVYTPGTPYVTGTVISSTVANNVNSDFATGLSTAIAKDGQTTITANIPMSNFKLTGLPVGSATGDSISWTNFTTLSTYTPTMNTNLTILAANAVQTYLKVGKLVTLWVTLVVDVVSGSDTVTMTLPVAAAAAQTNSLGASYALCSTSGVDTGDTGLVASIAAGASTATFFQNNDNAGQGTLTNTQLANGDIIGFTIQYFAAS